MSSSQRIDFVFTLYGILVVICAGINGLNITECDGQNGIIQNTRSNCSYLYLNCSGQDSMFCMDQRNCSNTYNCSEINNATLTTVLPGNDTTVSVTTVSPSTPAGIDVRRLCRQGVTQKYAYPQNCNYYYYCIDGFLLVEQCPLGYAFNERNQTCSGLIINTLECTKK